MKLPEIVAVGIYNSKYAAQNTKISKNRKTALFEIELPIANGGISYIDGQTSKITTDLLICAKPGQIRHTKFPFTCYYVHMIIHDIDLYNALIIAPTFIKTDKTDYYTGLFQKLCQYYKTGVKNHEIILHSILLELIYAITKDTKKSSVLKNVKNNTYPAIEKAISYIKENLTKDLSLETLAKHVSLSPIHFHNLFKSATGKTLHDFVEEQRIKEAINLLATTDMTLAEIALQCGFSSQSYFSYVFKRRMQTTPRKYLQTLNDMYEI